MISPDKFKQHVWNMAEGVGVKPNEVHLREMRRKWASCSSKGRLTFDTNLLNKSKRKRVETILHELLHLKYPNHGKMFKSLFSAYFKKYIEGGC